jgi:hypothetical protein
MGNFNFKKISFQSSKKKSHKEKEDKFVRFGSDNRFPEELIELYNNSSIHASCVNAIVQGIIGNGLTANEEEYTRRANSHGETWNDVFKKVAIDYELYGSFALEIIYSLDRSRIEVYHIDFSYVRAKEKNERGRIPGYFISSKWDKKGTYISSIEDDEDISYLPVYNPENKLEEPHQIYVHSNYRPGQQYYPLPDYVGALKVIDLDMHIDNWHSNNIQNGLAPSLVITTFTNGSDDQLRGIEGQLNSYYGGSDNAGSLMYMDVASKEEAPIITPLPQNGGDEYYTNINDMVMQKILTAHRITSPLILGIQQPGSLGNRQEMLDAFALFTYNVVQPKQQDILSSLEFLMTYNYPDVVLGVETETLFADGEIEEEVVVDNDTTDAETQEVETEENIITND